jgi:TetR/AcrR family transcriptional regulator
MVSRLRPPAPASRDRLLAAAAAEFAARGFDGAKVDRIAERAGLNKAMLYYHFTNKAALYRAILHDLFQALAGALAIDQAAVGPPADRLRRYVRTVAAVTAAHPHFPAIWLREMAEGGRHLDRALARDMASVLDVMTAIVRDGRRAGVFGDVHPFIVQMSIVAPLLLFSASAPIRERFQQSLPPGMATVERADLIASVELAALAALVPSARTSAVPARSARVRR